ncbi:fatty acid desaturase 4 [Quercus suber]|uniref:Fatty acid desaturase 4 n=1 Tax=Quercus suber TaxID=58331 RepID=A0AAW0JGN6_QUESU
MPLFLCGRVAFCLASNFMFAHTTKSRLPPLVIALQDMRLLVSRSQHADHHIPPYNDNYCIVSGVWNEFLDKRQIFKALEMILFYKLGVRPRSWSLVGYILADLMSGVYHWVIDNYGNASTPTFGDQIDAFQGHHEQP